MVPSNCLKAKKKLHPRKRNRAKLKAQNRHSGIVGRAKILLKSRGEESNLILSKGGVRLDLRDIGMRGGEMVKGRW